MKNTYTYPLICTRGALVFPNQEISIDVGRQVSINTVDFALQHDSLAVVVCQKDIKENVPGADNIYSVGTLCLIKSSRKRSDYYKVTFVGRIRCAILNARFQSDLIMADVELLEDVFEDNLKLEALSKRTFIEFNSTAVKLNRTSINSAVINSFDPATVSFVVDNFAQACVFDYKRKQDYLEENNVNKRTEMMLLELNRERMMEDIEKDINEKVRQSMEVSQRDYYLREKLKAIKEELGDDVSSDANMLREKVENNPDPEHVKQKALEEIKKYEIMPPAAGESGVSRS